MSLRAVAHEPACVCTFPCHVWSLTRSICCAELQKQVSYLSKVGTFPFPFLQLNHECVVGKTPLQVNGVASPVLCLAVITNTKHSFEKEDGTGEGYFPCSCVSRSLELVLGGFDTHVGLYFHSMWSKCCLTSCWLCAKLEASSPGSSPLWFFF